MLRSRSNCIVMFEPPLVEREVIRLMPGICAKARSSGATTDVDMVSGLAPGNCVVTEIVGKSTRGSADSGNFM